jgi:hypothetical protein
MSTTAHTKVRRKGAKNGKTSPKLKTSKTGSTRRIPQVSGGATNEYPPPKLKAIKKVSTSCTPGVSTGNVSQSGANLGKATPKLKTLNNGMKSRTPNKSKAVTPCSDGTHLPNQESTANYFVPVNLYLTAKNAWKE